MFQPPATFLFLIKDNMFRLWLSDTEDVDSIWAKQLEM